MTANKLVTVDDWSDLPDDARCELVEGEFFRKASPSADHSFAMSDLRGFLEPYLRKSGGDGGEGWWIAVEAHVEYPDRRNGFIHDLAGWRKSKCPTRPKGKRISQLPDWVCELVSSNRSNDYVIKNRVLHENRIEYYWTIDFRDKVIAVRKWVEGGYLIIQEASIGENVRLEPFDEIEIDVTALLGEVPD